MEIYPWIQIISSFKRRRDCIQSSSNRKCLIKHYPCIKSQVNHKFNKHYTYEIKTNMVYCWCWQVFSLFHHNSFFLSAPCSSDWWQCCNWIGGNDLDEEGKFTWISDKSTLVFVNWYPGQPDNKNNNQHCVSICQNEYWTDLTCTTVFRYICKAPAM